MIGRLLLGLMLAILASPASTQPDGLATLDRDVQSGVHGYVDHVLVLRNGQVAFDRSTSAITVKSAGDNPGRWAAATDAPTPRNFISSTISIPTGIRTFRAGRSTPCSR